MGTCIFNIFHQVFKWFNVSVLAWWLCESLGTWNLLSGYGTILPSLYYYTLPLYFTIFRLLPNTIRFLLGKNLLCPNSVPLLIFGPPWTEKVNVDKLWAQAPMACKCLSWIGDCFFNTSFPKFSTTGKRKVD